MVLFTYLTQTNVELLEWVQRRPRRCTGDGASLLWGLAEGWGWPGEEKALGSPPRCLLVLTNRREGDLFLGLIATGHGGTVLN